MMHTTPRAVVRVKLLDEKRNATEFEIPAFTREPQFVRWRERVYLRESTGVYSEAFGFPLAFNAEPAKPLT